MSAVDRREVIRRDEPLEQGGIGDLVESGPHAQPGAEHQVVEPPELIDGCAGSGGWHELGVAEVAGQDQRSRRAAKQSLAVSSRPFTPRAASTSRVPCFASAIASSRPRPDEAPVTIATCPLNT